MASTKSTKEQRVRRHLKVRTKISGTKDRPRLAVFRSNTTVSAQLIDDVSGSTLASASTKKAKGKTKLEQAKAVGKEIADQAKKQKIAEAVFDRGGFLYAGKVAAVADGAREGGLKF